MDKELEGILAALSRVAHSAISWNGFNVFGDKKSINEVQRLMHCEERMRWFEEHWLRGDPK